MNIITAPGLEFRFDKIESYGRVADLYNKGVKVGTISFYKYELIFSGVIRGNKNYILKERKQ